MDGEDNEEVRGGAGRDVVARYSRSKSLSSGKLIIFSTIFTFLIHLLSQFYFTNSILYSIILIPQFQLFYNLNLQLIVN